VDQRRPTAAKRPGKGASPPPPKRVPFWLVRLLLGSVLVAAGAIKLYELGFEAQDQSTQTLLLMVFAEFEFLSGLWLLLGLKPEQTRRWTAAAFAGLALASLFQGLAGKCTCGCFGSLPISPWIALFFDLLAVAALLGSRPPAGSDSASFASPMPLVGMAILALVVGIGGWGQADLVSVAGSATADCHPLEEATLTFTGESGRIDLRTDQDGRFRLPFVRPGQYAVSAPGRVVTRPVAQPQPAAKGRGKKKDTRQSERRGPAPNLTGVADPGLLWIEIPKCSQSDLVLKL
jgi:hypothetical protein